MLGTHAFTVYEDGLTPESVPPVTVTEVRLPEPHERAVGLAAGDLDGDGDDDLVSASSVWSSYAIYQLHYFPGGPEGIDGTRSELISASTSRGALAIADFDRDGRDDLVTNALSAGAEDPGPDHIIVRYGAPGGPGADRTQEIGPGSPGVPGDPDNNEGSFGSSLSAGDADGDGYPDLAVAAAGRDLGPGLEDAGQVTILRGSAAGLTGAGARSLSQDTRGVPDTAEDGHLFGFDVRLTPLDGDRRADLLVTAVGETLDQNPLDDAGAVWALRQGPPLGRVRSGTLLTADDLGVTGWDRWAFLPD
ncbi:FG-GAP and VCBS repeat-containing protein [Streptomyces sp. DSM 44917]|uniref:FG-GAP and VCBS repeat-containing protein n=1 Tax=Streptomyces boetiae TaxID=3075541 RepID=A0ABU2L5S6_9ACTN|nr:FG-GAP and VCBS repeat-containing protein [Streptomyces sp. DSM 44917]MDT0306919.1 FG-GAP and VCBS repeat-containing protein [Streptomyces sp. DSM 44917]